MSDLIENTTKQDEVEDQLFQTVIDYLPDWAKESLKRALAIKAVACDKTARGLANDVTALCSALAAALRQVQTERGNIESLSVLVEDHRAAVKYAVRGEREACASLVLDCGYEYAAKHIRQRSMTDANLAGMENIP